MGSITAESSRQDLLDDAAPHKHVTKKKKKKDSSADKARDHKAVKGKGKKASTFTQPPAPGSLEPADVSITVDGIKPMPVAAEAALVEVLEEDKNPGGGAT